MAVAANGELYDDTTICDTDHWKYCTTQREKIGFDKLRPPFLDYSGKWLTDWWHAKITCLLFNTSWIQHGNRAAARFHASEDTENLVQYHVNGPWIQVLRGDTSWDRLRSLLNYHSRYMQPKTIDLFTIQCLNRHPIHRCEASDGVGKSPLRSHVRYIWWPTLIRTAHKAQSHPVCSWRTTMQSLHSCSSQWPQWADSSLEVSHFLFTSLQFDIIAWQS